MYRLNLTECVFAHHQVCEMAYLKLHSLLQTVLCLSWEEVCFLLGKLGAPLWPEGLTEDSNVSCSETFSQLVPIMRTLLAQHADPITLQDHLPNLPITNGSTTFAEDLNVYCKALEWQSFYQQKVCVWTDFVYLKKKRLTFIWCLGSPGSLLLCLSDTSNSVLCQILTHITYFSNPVFCLTCYPPDFSWDIYCKV